jgi:isochorismate synthase
MDVLTSLMTEPHCIRFAFRRQHASFVGASPEVLFSKTGSEVASQALAGTIRSLGSDLPNLEAQSSRLLGSEKDRIEHEIVVREINDALAPLSVSIEHPDDPHVRKVRRIMHLNTPIKATLRPGVHPAELLAALHPTPAVGGRPVRGAVEWITRHERHARGWYTGALGWLDLQYDALFVVAIRCGVLAEGKAFVFTGAGIVGDSDAASEYAETALKQQPLLKALGVEGY